MPESQLLDKRYVNCLTPGMGQILLVIVLNHLRKNQCQCSHVEVVTRSVKTCVLMAKFYTMKTLWHIHTKYFILSVFVPNVALTNRTLGGSFIYVFITITVFAILFNELLPVCFMYHYVVPFLYVYLFIHWKSGTSDFLVLMLFVLQYTEKKCYSYTSST